jgi:D-sedoheptulose 7-phosphate isomerase
MKEHITKYLGWSENITNLMQHDDKMLESVQYAAKAMITALKDGKKILSCGNGGSMCDAMHFASELTGRYKESRDPIAAFALSDAAAMSCIGNDFGHSYVFRRQVIALGNIGDVLLAITTSGTSQNVQQAVVAAKQKGMEVIVLTGRYGMKKTGNSFEDWDIQINVPSEITNHIQEAHIKIIHILVELIEKSL